MDLYQDALAEIAECEAEIAAARGLCVLHGGSVDLLEPLERRLRLATAVREANERRELPEPLRRVFVALHMQLYVGSDAADAFKSWCKEHFNCD